MDTTNHFKPLKLAHVNMQRKTDLPLESQDLTVDLVQLVERLQTSLDITTLLQILADEVANYVDIASVELQHSTGHFQSDVNTPGIYQWQHELVVAEDYVGQLIFYCHERIMENDMRILSALASKTAFPIKHSLAFIELSQKALEDKLTGLANRCHFDDSFNKALTYAQTNNTELTLILLDLDNFKKANDTWGHAEGDNVLSVFAQVLKDSIRKSDIAYRFGGDEFAIILEGANEVAANRIAKTVRKNANCSNYLSEKGVSASIGYAKFTQGMTKKQLFNLADNALYKAKNSGRNCLRTA